VKAVKLLKQLKSKPLFLEAAIESFRLAMCQHTEE
jgi:hypothetical protein